jgi:hypothetical protein
MLKKGQANISHFSDDDDEEEEENDPEMEVDRPLGTFNKLSTTKGSSWKKMLYLCLILVIIVSTYKFFSEEHILPMPPILLSYPENIKQCWNNANSQNVDYYLVAATMIKNKRRYVREWIEFHLMMGVSYFLFYENNSDDGVEAIIQPYVDAGRASLVRWPPKEFPPTDDFTDPLLKEHFTHKLTECYENLKGAQMKVFYYIPCQEAAYDDAIRRTRGKARWVGGIDVDEFYYVPENSTVWKSHPEEPLVGAFQNLEKYNGITVSGQHFGTSGWYSPPRRDDDSQHAQLVTKTHLHHMEYIPGPLVKASEHIKAFVNPYCVYGNEIHSYMYDKDNLANISWKTTFHNTYDEDQATIRMNHFLWPSYIENFEKVARNVDPSTHYDSIYDRFVNKEEGSDIEYLLERLEKRIERSIKSKPPIDGHSDDWDYRLKNRHIVDQKRKDLCVILENPVHIGLARHALESIINYFFRIESTLSYQLVVLNPDHQIKKDLESDFPVDLFVEGETFSCSADFILRTSESSFAKWEQWPLEKKAVELGINLLKENTKVNLISLSDSSNLLNGWIKGSNISYRQNTELSKSGTYLMRKEAVSDHDIYEMCLHIDDSCPDNRIRSVFEDYQQERMYGYKPGFIKTK